MHVHYHLRMNEKGTALRYCSMEAGFYLRSTKDFC